MRLLTTFSLIGLAGAVAAPVAAQAGAGGAAPSVQGYLCTFAGKCDGVEAPQVTRQAPRTKGFRLARPSSEGATEARVGAGSPHGAVSARSPRPAQASQSRRAPANAVASIQGGKAYGAAPAVLTGRPRADLLIGFELNSAQLTPEGQAAALVFGRSLLMPELSGKRFVIEGHTDLRGGAQLNGPLSARRAQAVTQYLVSLGVPRNRLEPRGFGSSVPLPGHSVTDPANRRVEAELVP